MSSRWCCLPHILPICQSVISPCPPGCPFACSLSVRLSVSVSLSPFCLSVSCLPARRLCFSCQTNFVARLAGVVLICCSFALPAAPAPTLPPPLLPLAFGLSSLAQFEQILIYGYKAANGNGNLRRLLPRRLAQQN